MARAGQIQDAESTGKQIPSETGRNPEKDFEYITQKNVAKQERPGQNRRKHPTESYSVGMKARACVTADEG